MFFSVEHAITNMTKGENVQLQLKSKATTGIEKFNIPSNTPVQYDVTLQNFEKVRKHSIVKTLCLIGYYRLKNRGH